MLGLSFANSKQAFYAISHDVPHRQRFTRIADGRCLSGSRRGDDCLYWCVLQDRWSKSGLYRLSGGSGYDAIGVQVERCLVACSIRMPWSERRFYGCSSRPKLLTSLDFPSIIGGFWAGKINSPSQHQSSVQSIQVVCAEVEFPSKRLRPPNEMTLRARTLTELRRQEPQRNFG